MKKKTIKILKYVSAGSIALATIGLLITDLGREYLSDLREKKETVEETADRMQSLVQLASNVYDRCKIISGDFAIMVALNVHRKVIEGRALECKELRYKAIHYAAAASLKDRAPTEEEAQEWKSVTDAMQLDNIYMKYYHRTEAEHKLMLKSFFDLGDQISRKEKLWRRVFIGCIFLLSVGLFLSVIITEETASVT